MRREEETAGTPEGWCAKELRRVWVSFEAGEWERRDVVDSMRCCADVLLWESGD